MSDAVFPERHDHALPHPETTHTYLRRVTRDWHDRVDAAYASFDLTSRDGLAGFLLRHAAALLPLEAAIEESGAAGFLPDWHARRRTTAIMADLTHFRLAAPPSLRVPAMPSRLHGIGALYVLEGSKLGARVLLRRVASSQEPHVRGATRFLGHPNPGGWASFVDRLNGLPSVGATRASLEAVAKAAFAMFLPEPHGESGAQPLAEGVPSLSISRKHETARPLGGHAA